MDHPVTPGSGDGGDGQPGGQQVNQQKQKMRLDHRAAQVEVVFLDERQQVLVLEHIHQAKALLILQVGGGEAVHRAIMHTLPIPGNALV